MVSSKKCRREYHRLRYQNLSKDKKTQRIQQIRKSLAKRVNSLDPNQLDEYKQDKKRRDSIYYYNVKMKATLKDLQGLHISTSSTKRGKVFGERQRLVNVPNYICRIFSSFGRNTLPGGVDGCYVSIGIALFALVLLSQSL